MSSITERLAALLERTPPFDHLSKEERQQLMTNLEIYEPGEVILQQGTDIHRALYIVESGLVRLFDEDQGKLINMVGEGSIFGSYGLLQGGILPYEAKAVETTVCALVSAETFNALYKDDPAFAAHFDEDLKQYVRTLDTEMDASGAFLLFETSLANVVYRDALTCTPDATVQEAAGLMREHADDTVLVVQDGSAMGLITEGDIVNGVVATGSPLSTPVMDLVERPPVALSGSDRLFDAVRVMMEYRIRRVVITGSDPQAKPILGVVTAEDIAHFRGLDPVATVERLEKARSVKELAQIRSESTRRLFRLYQQGVQSESLLAVVAEMDDQLKARLLHLVEEQARADQPDLAVDLPWAWLAFGAPGRREAALFTSQSNGLVYADPADEGEAERAAQWFAFLAERAVAALGDVGIRPSDEGILASEEPFRQPLSQWVAAYDQWVAGADTAASLRSALCFDVRGLYGDDGLVDQLLKAIRARLENSRRLLAILMRGATKNRPPISFFGRFELEQDEGAEGLNLRERGLDPIVDMVRTLALETGHLRSTNTFRRLRHLREALPDLEREQKVLLGAFATLSDMHLRAQMQAAETGVTPTDLIDPNALHKSQQNLLKETFKKVDKVQQALQNRYERG
ncbi:MAG: putative nucleotidyltransferase substrate binding domain-containing protein [Bacteroidota bacterium]